MNRAVTAVYPTEISALDVREELVRLGIPDGDITMIPETPSEAYGIAADSGTPSAGRVNSDDLHERLDRLGLPDDDTRTYLQAVRNGDYVLSVEVDEGDRLDRVKAIMRDPGHARDLDALDEQYRDAAYVPFRHEDRPATADERAVRQNSGPGERADLRDYARNRDRSL